MALIFVDFFSNFSNLPLSTEQSGQSEVDFLLYYSICKTSNPLVKYGKLAGKLSRDICKREGRNGSEY